MNDHSTEGKDPVGLHTLEVVAKAGRFNRWMYDQFRHELQGEILEIGSGIGNISRLVIEEGHPLTLSDYNDEYCFYLKKIFEGNKIIQNILRIDLLDSDFEKLFEAYKEKFNTIFLLNVIEHIDDDARAVKNCHYLLKPGGRLIVLAPAYNWLFCSLDKQLGHYKRYTIRSMISLLTKENFNISNGSYFNFIGIAGWFLFGKIIGRKMLGRSEMIAFDSIIPVAKLADKMIGKKAGLSIIVTAIKN
jgi:SAM-dependent methyltransferase